jgi:hypothetical protein
MMTAMRRAAFTVISLAALLAACGSESVPTDYLVYDRDPATQEYRLVESRIETLTDVARVNGSIVNVRGGGNLTIASGEPTTEQEWEEALAISGDNAPNVQYEVEDGIVVPWDFDSLMMLTLYHHLERASEYFESVGVTHATVRKLKVYYFAELKTLIPLPIPLLTDNAAYVVTVDAFLIPPRLILNDVPLYANRGVVVHEYSHAVFNRLVHRDRRVPRYFLDDWPTAAVNEMRSLDEGIADIFAALAVDDPDFISPSVSAELFDIDRDVSRERFYDGELLDVVMTDDTADYDPYALGSVIASALWALRSGVDPEVLGKAVVRTLGSLAGPSSTFRVTQFFDRLAAELPPAVQASACQTFRDRLPAVEADLGC